MRRKFGPGSGPVRAAALSLALLMAFGSVTAYAAGPQDGLSGGVDKKDYVSDGPGHDSDCIRDYSDGTGSAIVACRYGDENWDLYGLEHENGQCYHVRDVGSIDQEDPGLEPGEGSGIDPDASGDMSDDGLAGWHGAGCWQENGLVCGAADAAHEHGPDCYATGFVERTGAEHDDKACQVFENKPATFAVEESDPDAETVSRYRHQAWWWWNDRHDTRVWWAGFEFNDAENAITPYESQIDRVVLTTLGGGSDGTVFEIAEGDGTDYGTATGLTSGDGVRLVDIFPDAGPKSNHLNVPGAITDDSATGEAFVETDGDGAYYYVECGRDEASYMSAEKLEMWGWADTGIMPCRQRVSNYEGDNTTFQMVIESAAEMGGARNIKYYKKLFRSEVVSGHQHVKLEITPKAGYYVTNVVITCANNRNGQQFNPVFNAGNAYRFCNTFNAGDAFRSDFDMTQWGRVSVVLDSEDFSHYGSISNKYFIMIHTEPIPLNLHVQYDAGTAGDVEMVKIISDPAWVTEAMVAAGPEFIERIEGREDVLTVGEGDVRDEDKLTYTIAGPSEKALEEARAAGYEFAGWKLQYYNSDPDDNPDWENALGIEMATRPNDTKVLWSHAKLVAQWTEIKADPEGGGGPSRDRRPGNRTDAVPWARGSVPRDRGSVPYETEAQGLLKPNTACSGKGRCDAV